MKKIISSTALGAIAAGGMLFASCGDHDMFNANYIADEYAANWEQKIGAIDPNQDWSMAAQKTVNITVDGTKTVQILTGNPYLNEGQIAGEFTVTTQLSAKIDLCKGTDVIYAVQRNENGTKDVRTTYISEDGMFNVNFSGSTERTPKRAVTRSGNRTATELNVTRNNFLDLIMYYANEEYNIWDFNSIVNDYMTNSGSRHKIAFNSWGDKYFDASAGSVSNSTVYVDKTLKDAVANIVPENLKSSYYNTIIQDVDLVVKEEGPVSLTLLSATTSNNAAIGYYIYTDKAVNNEDIAVPSDYPTIDFLKDNGYNDQWSKYYQYISSTRIVTDKQKLADKIIIIPNVRNSDISSETIWSGEQMGGSNCKKINLLYKDPQTGLYSENFPAGTKIAFFVVPNAAYNANNNSIDASRTVFSFADMNVDVHKSKIDGYYYSNFNAENYSSSHAATFKVQDKIVIGFEDAGAYSSGDFDYNDCIFLLDGSFDEEIIPDPIPEKKPEYQSWILACEDLGDADDRDFNDIVLEVRKNIESNKAEVRCLAAGGTLPANIYYDGQPVGESHAMLGGETKQMINTSGTLGRFSDWKEIEADATGWTITDNIDKFQIKVTMNDKTMVGTLISAPAEGKTPHMIIVPGEWEWPIERKNINEAYPKFVDWNANASITDWNSAKEADMVVKRK